MEKEKETLEVSEEKKVKMPNVNPYNKVREEDDPETEAFAKGCLLYTSPSPRDGLLSRMPSSA